MSKAQASAPKGATTIDLPPHLDLTAAGPLHERLLAVRGEPIVIDASAVERLGGQCLQVLISSVITWKADMIAIEIVKPSEGFEEGLKLLGFSIDTLLEQEIQR